MNLLNNFCAISEVTQSGEKCQVTVQLNPEHEIYQGHFPGNPVVPGVCMVQIVKDILEKMYKKEFTMMEAAEIKFLTVITPTQTPSFIAEFSITEKENQNLFVTGLFKNGEVIYFKWKAIFSK